MTSQNAADSLTPAYEAFDPERPLGPEELRRAQSGGLFPLPEGWRVVGGYRTTLHVGFVDARSNPFPPGMILGDTDEPRQPVLETEDIPQVCLFLERGVEQCAVTIDETSAPLAKNWSQAAIQGGELTTTRLGRAGVGGPTAVIDGDERLIRATYDRKRGATERGSSQDDVQHLEDAREGAREFLQGVLA